jgi:hypothetical protein
LASSRFPNEVNWIGAIPLPPRRLTLYIRKRARSSPSSVMLRNLKSVNRRCLANFTGPNVAKAALAEQALLRDLRCGEAEKQAGREQRRQPRVPADQPFDPGCVRFP